MSQNQQPIFILSEGSQRTTGREAQRNNMMAAKLVAETVRTTLGPKGMDKMLVDSLGDIIVTNDGVTILQEMQIEHPAAKMVVEVAKTQENEVGDGTTTAVILAGELLKNAERLLEKNIHPTVIAKGYRMAANQAQLILQDISQDVNLSQEDVLKNIASTAMTGKGAEVAKDNLSKLIVDAIKHVIETKDGKIVVHVDDVKLEKKVGSGIGDSELIEGILLDKEKVHSNMPSHVEDAKVALLDVALEIKNTEVDAKIQITDPSQMQAFIDMENKMITDMVTKVVKSGANVVLCQKGIDDLAQHYLAKNKIYACRRIKKSDMEKLSRATGGKIVSSLNELSQSDLGYAALVEEKKFGDEEMTYVTGCKEAKSVTLLVRGGTQHVVDEAERAIKDAIGDISAALKVGKIVGGAGSTEVEVSSSLRKFATSLSGREQLAVEAFADALEVIPITLAENAGLDPIDTITALKAAHERGEKWAGLDVFSGKVVNAWDLGVVEPLKIKTQAIKSASEVAELILRIDDVLAAGTKDRGGMPPGMPSHGMDM
ncbi:TCP-1/cpn60 chaperonin family protein [Candidatus Woesearchaeota archaeon]|nr:TCP-1/cpn60 chaperonin family protein [Candidatus Woesearchaeota archaeon]